MKVATQAAISHFVFDDGTAMCGEGVIHDEQRIGRGCWACVNMYELMVRL